MKKIKYFMKKHKNRILSVFCSLLLIPLFTVRSFAFDFFYNTIVTDFMQMRLEANVSLNSGSVSPNEAYYYNFSNNSATGIRFFNTIFLATWDVMFDNVNYDYYVSLIVDSQSDDSFSFRPDRINVRRLNDDGSINDSRMEDFHIYEYNGWNTGGRSKGYRILAKFPDSFGYSIRGFSMLNDNLGSLPSNINVSVVIIQTNKDSSAEMVNAIVQAINNQTDDLGGRIDGTNDRIDETNDLIQDGDKGTQSAITDFNEVFEDFNEELENWEQFDDEIIGEFESANTEYLTELNNFSLSGSLLNAGNWLSTSMQTVYDNSSDYKMLWLVPLLFGIPILLFIIRKNGDDE